MLSSEKSKLLHFSAVVVSNNAPYFSRGPENTQEGKWVLPISQTFLVSDPLRKKNQLQEAVKGIRNRQTHWAANTLLRAGKHTLTMGWWARRPRHSSSPGYNKTDSTFSSRHIFRDQPLLKGCGSCKCTKSWRRTQERRYLFWYAPAVTSTALLFLT